MGGDHAVVKDRRAVRIDRVRFRVRAVVFDGVEVFLEGAGEAGMFFFEQRVAIENFLASPSLGAGSAPAGVNEADGNFEILVEVAAEEIPGGREAAHGLRTR